MLLESHCHNFIWYVKCSINVVVYNSLWQLSGLVQQLITLHGFLPAIYNAAADVVMPATKRDKRQLV